MIWTQHRGKWISADGRYEIRPWMGEWTVIDIEGCVHSAGHKTQELAQAEAASHGVRQIVCSQGRRRSCVGSPTGRYGDPMTTADFPKDHWINRRSNKPCTGSKTLLRTTCVFERPCKKCQQIIHFAQTRFRRTTPLRRRWQKPLGNMSTSRSFQE